EHARRCLASGDTNGRVRSVNRAYDAVMELTFSLDHSAGGEMSRQLSELYAYVSHKIVVGHGSQSDEAFAEASRLLSTMLDSWNMLARGESMPAVQTEWSQTVTTA
ncbi:MAG TPA: flagellar protein FliS, partial [Bryobacteraceae bacterium]|nr:flagellar protein FliS [Bryobacteraceae bacterium]